MTIVNEIVPGKVDNRGINDKSIPTYSAITQVYPKHLPVISGVFPKGALASEKGTQFVPVSAIASMFGSITDETTPYYNPIGQLINELALRGQSTVGIRRLSANTKKSYVPLSAFIKKITVVEYETDLTGAFKRDENGEKIPTGKTFEGLDITVAPDPEGAKAQGADYGKRPNRVIPGTPAQGDTPAVSDTQVLPIQDYLAGVGEDYNRGGLAMGVQNSSLNWKSISAFVKATGVFPFSLKLFQDTKAGVRTYSKTTTKQESATFTFFPTKYNGVQQGPTRGLGAFTNLNVNRKVVPIPQPLNEVFTYAENIESICQMLYVVEREVNDTLLTNVSSRPWQQMNFLTCTNHLGAPYKAIVSTGTQLWDLTGTVKATGGINPFYNDAGELPDYAPKVDLIDPFGLLADQKFPITTKQAWAVTNHLMAADMQTYVNGSEVKNYTRNRQSMFWDVGFTQEVKDVAVQLLASRRDIIVVQDATVWDPEGPNDMATIYSRFSALTASARMYPESEQWGTATCRSSTNLIEAKVNNEATGGYFSGNIDLAGKFAAFAGGANGLVIAALSPDHEDNRILSSMHSPNIEFEEDDVGNDNFENGGITLRPLDTDQLYRPALVTVYSNPDSVLKDLVTNFLCVCMEKITQDKWNTVSGDTTISASEYVALVKDRAERQIRDDLGGLVRQVTVTPSYDEGQVGSRAILNTRIDAYFNKGKYMMTMDLYAFNEQDLSTTNAA